MRIATVVRANEWREYKIAPLLAVFYATLVHLRAPILPAWPQTIELLIALVAGAVYVSLINDLTDRVDNSRAGKPNRLAGVPTGLALFLLAAPVAVGLAVAWDWRNNPPLVAVYAAAWISFTAYSVPPLRLKARTFAGVLADASGAHLFPSLTAALLAFGAAGRMPDMPWLAAIGLWSACFGVRGILWHQVADDSADRAAGVRTLVVRYGQDRAHIVAEWIAFPLEFASLLALLWMLDERAPLVALALYAFFAIGKLQRFELKATISRPWPRYLLLLNGYYEVFLPVSLLAASALRHSGDLWVLAVHCFLFPGLLAQTLRDCLKIPRRYLD